MYEKRDQEILAHILFPALRQKVETFMVFYTINAAQSCVCAALQNEEPMPVTLMQGNTLCASLTEQELAFAINVLLQRGLINKNGENYSYIGLPAEIPGI